ncbi:ribonuclease HIII [Planococcus antarcticus DSM 14505]|uniref:Ribonuclease HIII n=1 Tax=Planococcus antarcticus DSM 14505 TaxID=1185653 RepID=A0A1C7DIX2_9BACL|nr:ribonuclease HIII [Planococcus antarcticus]ANU11357.1 ribonuclease HIII [Planococcus antarcticus DSM 14505]EIM05666.1 ribonuclease HIII [Planococcus antarcticus DSM 14505]
MSNTVLKLTEEHLLQVISHYQKNKIQTKNPYARFSAKLTDTVVTVYTSGKVMFQGNGADREAAKWGVVSATEKTIATKGDKLPDGFTKLSVLGSDETGTGDFFGPITVAACYVPADKVELARELGVKDSKQLTDDWMRQVAPDLRAAFAHKVLTLKNDKYNKVQGQGWSQGKIKALLHNQALKHVLANIAPNKPDFILIDQFAERGIYYKHIKDEPEIIRENVLFSTKAEGLHVSVACASIIARVAFLEEMDRMSLEAGVTLPKGAGKIVDESAAKIILKHGEEYLKGLTKVHFANTEKAKGLAEKRQR